MRHKILTLSYLLALAACKSDEEIMRQALERNIQGTIQSDWHDGIPLDDLITASSSCRTYPSLQGCNMVKIQMDDIATTLSSCHADQRSRLCQAVVRVIEKHPIHLLLLPLAPIKLPDTPLYWELPTMALKAQSGNFEYRQETAAWFWESWRNTMLYCLALLVGIVTVGFGWSSWRKQQQERAQMLNTQRAEKVKLENARRLKAAQEAAELEREANLTRQAVIEEQKCIAVENAEKQKMAKAAAKLAVEQAEASQLLALVFNSKGNVHR